MIIDCHTHLFRYPDDYGKEFIEDYRRIWDISLDSLKYSEEDHFNAMKAVDRAIVFGLRSRALHMNTSNDFIARYVNAHSDKIIGFLSVDPDEEDVVREIRRCVKDLGLKGIKLGPIYQNFHPQDRKAYPIYETAQELNIPIMIHQGTTFIRRAPLEFAQPIQLERIALDFPDLKMIVAHLGHPWEEETIVLIRKQPNIYSDISALTPRPYRLYNDLVLCMEYGVLDKLLFGSDYPFTNPADSMKKLRRINRFAEGTNLPRIPIDAIESIIKENAVKALNL